MRFRTFELYLKKVRNAKFRLEWKDKISRNRRKSKDGSDDVVNGETVASGLLDGLPINYVIVSMDGSEIASESARDRFYKKKIMVESRIWRLFVASLVMALSNISKTNTNLY